MILKSLSKYSDIALLFLRVGLGIMFILHGLPKMTGGVEVWTKLGGAMSAVGISFFPAFWGFMAAITEVFGGFLLILGLLTRPACILLAFTMLIAALMHLQAGDGFKGSAHAIELCIVFITMIFLGPGRISIDKG